MSERTSESNARAPAGAADILARSLGEVLQRELKQPFVVDNRPGAGGSVAALAVAGLLLQTAFNNPLAGPSILGIDTGASLGVALVMVPIVLIYQSWAYHLFRKPVTGEDLKDEHAY